MRPEPTALRAAAAETGFRAETLEKVVRLGELLAEIARHPLLGHVLALKGGTALNLLVEAPPRLSVDLDFNYVGGPDREEMLRGRPEVEGALNRLARALGYRVQLSSEEHAGRKLYLAYPDLFGAPSRVEIDVNYLHRQPLADPVRLPLWQPAGVAQPLALVLSLEEIAAGKLCALLDRAAPRDLFDTARLPARLGNAWAGLRLRRIFVALAGVLPRPLAEYGRDRLERVTAGAVNTQLGPMLRAGELPALEVLRDAAWRAVEPLLALDDAEREFGERLQRGELVADLLFPEDAALAERLARHPALLWKAENSRAHARGRL